MIIVCIKGGLGNQLFQYAFGKALSIKHNRKLYFHVTNIYNSRWYKSLCIKYRLDKYNIQNQQVSKSMSLYISIVKRKKLYKLFNYFTGIKYINRFLPVYFNENDFQDVDITKYYMICLDGHWENYEYFEDYENILKKDFTLIEEMTAENKKYLKEIESTNSVSIHFIKGFKVKDPRHKKIYHESSFSYYLDAYDYCEKKLDQPKFFVFSNDIDLVKKNWPIDKLVTFVDNSGPDYQHHYLMKNCRHNIIDNSTFSFSAAYLNNNENKIVIAPNIWTKKIKMNKPEDWIILDN